MSSATIVGPNDASTTVGASSVVVLAGGNYNIRNFLLIHNPDTAKIVAVNLTGGTAAINTAGSLTLAPGAFVLLDFAVTWGTITAIGSTSGCPLTIYWG